MNKIEILEYMIETKNRLEEDGFIATLELAIENLQKEIEEEEESDRKARMTDEEETFIKNSFLGANPLK